MLKFKIMDSEGNVLVDNTTTYFETGVKDEVKKMPKSETKVSRITFSDGKSVNFGRNNRRDNTKRKGKSNEYIKGGKNNKSWKPKMTKDKKPYAEIIKEDLIVKEAEEKLQEVKEKPVVQEEIKIEKEIPKQDIKVVEPKVEEVIEKPQPKEKEDNVKKGPGHPYAFDKLKNRKRPKNNKYLSPKEVAEAKKATEKSQEITNEELPEVMKTMIEDNTEQTLERINSNTVIPEEYSDYMASLFDKGNDDYSEYDDEPTFQKMKSKNKGSEF